MHIAAAPTLAPVRRRLAENVLLDFEFSAKIADFGVSRRHDADKTLSAEVGTPLFSAPEMLCTVEPRYDQAVDVWAAGCVLVCLASNHRLPYSEEACSSSKLLAEVHRGKTRPALPSTDLLSSCVRACCRFKPESRINAAGLERATEALAREHPRRGSSLTRPEPMGPVPVPSNRTPEHVKRD